MWLLTVHGFKQLCMAANTDKARKVRDYYIAMEEVMFEYTKRKMEQQDAALALKDAEVTKAVEREAAMKEQLTLKDADLQRFLEKTYGECPKLDNIYIHKAVAEMHKAGDPAKRESQLNTSLAPGGLIIYKKPTHNAEIIEDVVLVVMKRYHYIREHYHCNVEHSINTIDIIR